MSEESPVASISPQTLDELFDRDPLSLADADISRIVSVLREQRLKWAAGESAAQTSEKKKTKSAKLTPKEVEALAQGLGI